MSWLLTHKLAAILFLISLTSFICGSFILSDHKPEALVISSSDYPTTSITATSSAVPSETAQITIDVSGAIIKPSIYTVGTSTRIGQLIDLAGGYSKSADLKWISKNINLAQKLKDSDKIYIPTISDTYKQLLAERSPPPTPQVAGVTTGDSGYVPSQSDSEPSSEIELNSNSTDSKISINSSSESQLDTLPGIGPVTAQKIINNRPYSTIEDLLEKKAVGNSTFEKIKDLIIL